jgi:hypothetical protein
MGDEMKDSPTLFSTPMVQAIADGRKTTTRRVLDKVPEWITHFGTDNSTPKGCITGFGNLEGGPAQMHFKSPYGLAGDRLWVRETWRPNSWGEDFDWMMIEYKAGGAVKNISPRDTWEKYRVDDVWEKLINEVSSSQLNPYATGWHPMPHPYPSPLKWRPSIFLPRNACRTILDIKDVRVEKLRSITDEEAIAEGARHIPDIPLGWGQFDNCRWSMEDKPKDTAHCLASPRLAFLNYWDKLNKKRGFGIKANPWVWVIQFKRIEDAS